MTVDKIDSVLMKYIVKLQDEGITPKRHVENSLPFRPRHILWMCINCKGWLSEEHKEKAFRWLGFIQGVLWCEKIYTIDELKDHNRSDY